MDFADLLSHQRLASGIPFGLALGLVGLVGTGAVSVAVAIRARRPRLRVIAAFVGAAALGRLALAVAAEAFVRVELNPVVRAVELYGDWHDGPQQLVLAPDSTFRLLGPIQAQGAWALRDADLQLGGRDARVIEACGERRTVLEWPEDPDLWNGHLGMKRAR